MKKYTLLLALFVSTFSYAQITNMYTEMPYGQNINCAYADGNFIWFGTDFGLVKYNRLTGDKVNYTYFDIMEESASITNNIAPAITNPSQVNFITKDNRGNFYFVMGGIVCSYDGFVWNYIYTDGSQIVSLKYSDNKVWIEEELGGNLNELYYDINLQQIVGLGPTINAGLVDNKGHVWGNDGSGDIIVQDSAGNILASYTPTDFPTSSYIDSKGIFWFTCYDIGLKLDYLCNIDTSGTINTYTVPNFNVPYCESIMQADANGDLYIIYTLISTAYNPGNPGMPIGPPTDCPFLSLTGHPLHSTIQLK